jgi:peptidoglycan-associated lipoprotein
MKNKALLVAVLSLTSILFTSCDRSHREVWEDTKTAKRYMNKGIKSLFGRHEGTKEIVAAPKWKEEPDFLPLTDDDRYQGGSTMAGMRDYPISRESPGDPGSSIPGIDAFHDPSGQLAALFRNIRFETDQYTVKGTENLESLHTIAEYLKSHPGTYVFVEGHADERGAASYNLSLSAKRSNSVRGFLIEQGVNPDQLFSISYGKERPLSLEHDEMAWQQNRRAQFKLYER